MTPTLETPPSMDLPSDASLLDAVGEGVLVVNVDEHELYAGERLARWPAAVREQVRRVCIDVLRHDAADRSSRRFQLAAGE
ncbi:MAG: hypothetical protein AAF561_13510, partial [Planctomycetota bacterium]